MGSEAKATSTFRMISTVSRTVGSSIGSLFMCEAVPLSLPGSVTGGEFLVINH